MTLHEIKEYLESIGVYEFTLNYDGRGGILFKLDGCNCFIESNYLHSVELLAYGVKLKMIEVARIQRDYHYTMAEHYKNILSNL